MSHGGKDLVVDDDEEWKWRMSPEEAIETRQLVSTLDAGAARTWLERELGLMKNKRRAVLLGMLFQKVLVDEREQQMQELVPNKRLRVGQRQRTSVSSTDLKGSDVDGDVVDGELVRQVSAMQMEE